MSSILSLTVTVYVFLSNSNLPPLFSLSFSCLITMSRTSKLCWIKVARMDILVFFLIFTILYDVNCRFVIHFSSITQSCPTLCDPMYCSTPGFPVHHQLPELAQTPVHWVSDAIQPSHALLSPSPPTFIFAQHQGLFQWISSSNQVAKVLEFQRQHQSFQWILRTDFL